MDCDSLKKMELLVELLIKRTWIPVIVYTCFRSRHPEFPVFVPAGIAKSDMMSRIVEDVDPNGSAPPDVDPSAPLPENRFATQIFSFQPSQCSSSLYGRPAGVVADI